MIFFAELSSRRCRSSVELGMRPESGGHATAMVARVGLDLPTLRVTYVLIAAEAAVC